MITVCFIENIDPVGVHSGDSFCSAPMLTISEEVQKKLQDQAYRIVDAIEVIGGTNVQLAHDPISGRVVVIEIAIVEVQFATAIAVTIVDRTTPVVIADERCSCHL